MCIRDRTDTDSQPTKDPVLKVDDLRTHFRTLDGIVRAVDGVSFEVGRGETLGVVGESGCGKSVTAMTILRLLAMPPASIESGEIWYGDRDLLKLSEPEMRAIRGNDISMIFQEPMTSLNPVFPIGKQVMEPLIYHKKCSQEQAIAESVKLLEQVGIPDAKKRLWDYPHQFSGGMRQRVMIAMALICKPSLLIADEPTTALDVTIQAQILDLMKKLQKERSRSSILLITHDLSVIAETCHRVIVMYGGKIQEIAPVNLLFKKPLHPYTEALIKSIPIPSTKTKGFSFTISGDIPSMMDKPNGCKFHPRCKNVKNICREIEPKLSEISPGWFSACHMNSNL